MSSAGDAASTSDRKFTDSTETTATLSNATPVIFEQISEANVANAALEDADEVTDGNSIESTDGEPQEEEVAYVVDPDFLDFFYSQEKFVSDVAMLANQKMQSSLPLTSTVVMPNGGGDGEPLKLIESEEELIDRQKQLAMREEAVIEQVKSNSSYSGDATPLRSDSFEQLIRDTTGGGGGGGGGAPKKEPQGAQSGGNQAVRSSAEDVGEVNNRKILLFYAALALAIAFLLANKYFF